MRKQVIFLIAWDVAFFIFLNAICRSEDFVFEAYYKMKNPFLGFYIPIISWVAAGSAFYFTTAVIFYFAAPAIINALPFLRPWWLVMDRNAVVMTMGGILFGYELLMFIVRMVRYRRKENSNPAEQK